MLTQKKNKLEKEKNKLAEELDKFDLQIQESDESVKLGENYIDNVYSRYNKSSDYTSRLVDAVLIESKIYTTHYDIIIKSFLSIFTISFTALLTLIGLNNYVIFGDFILLLVILILLLLSSLFIVILTLNLRYKKISETQPIMKLARKNALMLLERVNATILLGIHNDVFKRKTQETKHKILKLKKDLIDL